MMATFTTKDRELVKEEPILLYGFYYLTDSASKDKNAL